MWIVRLALRRPYTFAVLALLLMIPGPIAVFNTPTDIFPNINIPVIAMVWQYTGFSPEQMADRITTLSERSLTTTVNDIEHIESQSLNGIAVIKIFFQPHANIGAAIAQVVAIGTGTGPAVAAGNDAPLHHPLQRFERADPAAWALGSRALSEQQLNDYGLNFIRTQLVDGGWRGDPVSVWRQTAPGAGRPQSRSASVEGAFARRRCRTRSTAQNLILPSGTAKIGTFEYQVETQQQRRRRSQELNDLPIKTVNGATIYIHDVAHVRDGFPPQTNIVRVDGQRAALLTILKTGNASTLDIVKGMREAAAADRRSCPRQLKFKPLSDQSIFVRASDQRGGSRGRDCRVPHGHHDPRLPRKLAQHADYRGLDSAVDSLLADVLSALGETINIMTLGGLALAVGILVDDATVEIENINRNLEQGKELCRRFLTARRRSQFRRWFRRFPSALCFVPMFFLTGVAKYLFVPLGEAVVFAMLASYILSRTVVPTMAKYLLQEHDDEAVERKQSSRNPLVRFQMMFERGFERFRGGYHRILQLCIEHSAIFLIVFMVFVAVSSVALYPFLGQDFFPSVDSGQFKLHVRAQTGTRIEDTAALCDRVDDAIRETIPKKELVTIIDNIGLPYSGINTVYSNSAPIGPADADIQVSLTEKHHPTDAYVQELRTRLNREFPGVTFYTLPVDMVTQILNFGLPARSISRSSATTRTATAHLPSGS